ncbi:phosphotransferase [Brachybacterium huguangmaarense]
MRRNSYALAALAAAAVPGLLPERTVPIATPVEELDVAGVIGADGRRVLVTAPSSPAAGAHLAKDLGVSEVLAGTGVSDLIPQTIGAVRLPEGGRAVVTDPPSGAPLLLDALADPALARSLGRTLARIHTVPAHVAEAAGAETFSAASVRALHRAQVARAQATDQVPAAVAQHWAALLADDDLWDFRPCFVHGSLSEENLFTDGEAITGVIGWQDARSGDPAADLAWLVSAVDPAVFAELHAAYVEALPAPPDAHLLDRAQAIGEFAVADWLLHGIDADDATIVEDARAMLADLDEDIAAVAREEAERMYDDLDARSHAPRRAVDGDAADATADGSTDEVARSADDAAAIDDGVRIEHDDVVRVDLDEDAPAGARDTNPISEGDGRFAAPGDRSGSHFVGLGEAATMDKDRGRRDRH